VPYRESLGGRFLATAIAGGTIALNVRAHQIALARHYDKPFGTFAFRELAESARTRLGLNNLTLPLPEPMTSPFGIGIREIVIPGHLAPQSNDPVIMDLAPSEDGYRFRVGDRHYHYSRLGLELAEAPPACE